MNLKSNELKSNELQNNDELTYPYNIYTYGVSIRNHFTFVIIVKS